MDVSEDEMSTWRLAEMSPTGSVFLEDDTEVWEPKEELYLAIEHKNPNTGSYSSYSFPKDKPLIIRG